ncbi:MAG TPA: universal stress protein, partial [Polyangiaceae bacterium]
MNLPWSARRSRRRAPPDDNRSSREPCTMLRRILVALDASERASGVLESAVELAQTTQATLFLLRVIAVPPEFPAAATGNAPDRLPAYLAANAMQALLLLGEGAMHGTKIGAPIVGVGDPWRVILDTAEERDVDLIVLGSHGYSGWD